jgi:hypothetical protein
VSYVRTSRWAEASANDEFVCIQTYSGYRLPVRDPQARQYLLSPGVDDGTLGEAVVESLAASRFLALEEANALMESRGERYSAWVAGLMLHYGYKSRRALFKRMKSCWMECENQALVIRPTRHDRLESWDAEGIKESDQLVVNVEAPPSDIGSALRLALSRCR